MRVSELLVPLQLLSHCFASTTPLNSIPPSTIVARISSARSFMKSLPFFSGARGPSPHATVAARRYTRVSPLLQTLDDFPMNFLSKKCKELALFTEVRRRGRNLALKSGTHSTTSVDG